MQRDELKRLSEAELIDLVLRMWRLEDTPRISSKPPSTDRTKMWRMTGIYSESLS